MTENKVTVLLNFYKEKEFQVRRALDSLINQTFKNFDLFIVIDGNDTANIKIIVQDYLEHFPNFRLEILDSNYGVAYAKNFAIKKIHTKYIAYLDGDDEFLPLKLEKQIVYMEQNPNVDVLGCSIIPVDEANKSRYFYEKYDNIINLKYKMPVHNPTIFTKKSIFESYGYYDESYNSSEDYDLFIRWYLSGVKFANLEEYLFKYYRDTSGSNANLKRHVITAFFLKLKYSKQLSYNLGDYLRLFLMDGILCLLPRNILKHIYFFVNINILGKNNAK